MNRIIRFCSPLLRSTIQPVLGAFIRPFHSHRVFPSQLVLSPTHDLFNWFKVNDFFNDMFPFTSVDGDKIEKSIQNKQYNISPSLHVSESPTHFIVRVDVPGISEDALKVSLDGDSLVISGERSSETKDEEKTWYKETHYGSFKRYIKLPSGIDTETIKARVQDGVLSVELPRKEPAKSLDIPIEITN